ncbi:MAG: aminotransferase class I/II-fold pyridoxal phosphate-dependent enzyme [Clostridia bacterium]|nr:aminotransferase class I/II-fold pyridoxal phosphate-dependent enzyme [Clostridia bacterium]MDD3093563.1 aminotransferase class I/II-fold pyridoxal phosphate-dependent enzyme [Clostridia bacterium]HXK71085.1 aminotransferase class I/II-fold pyridoxal phosphate-dependent enzyme [Clostridia bacterium]
MKKPKDFIRSEVEKTPPSGIRKYFDMLHGMDDVISLGVGEPDFTTPWQIRESAIHALEKGRTHYTSNNGILQLREALSLMLHQKYNLNYDPKDQIIITVGASEAIDIAIRSIAGCGDEVIIPQPCFVAYKGCVNFTGAKAVPLQLSEDNCFKLTVDQLEKCITDKTKAIILAYPNNPTGAVMTKEELAPIADYLSKKDIMVISDEIYAELTYGMKHTSFAEFENMHDKVIYVNGFSKAYSMTGWRLGYVCAHRDIISQMIKIHQYAIMCAPSFVQYAAIDALKQCDGDVINMRNEYDARRRYIYNGLKNIGIDCFEPKGAFYVFPNIRKTGLTSEQFCDRLLMEHKVLVVPGTAFSDAGEGFFRATYASSLENIKEALKRIERFMKTLK